MRLMELLTTQELEQQIQEEYIKIQHIVEKLNIHFYKNFPNANDGIYVYANTVGYHYIQCERGNEEVHKLTDDVFEIKFWVFYPLTLRAAFRYEVKHRNEKLNYREVAFNKQLEYLSILGENFRKRGEIEIDEILKINPY